jgi:hypothetical protein
MPSTAASILRGARRVLVLGDEVRRRDPTPSAQARGHGDERAMAPLLAVPHPMAGLGPAPTRPQTLRRPPRRHRQRRPDCCRSTSDGGTSSPSTRPRSSPPSRTSWNTVGARMVGWDAGAVPHGRRRPQEAPLRAPLPAGGRHPAPKRGTAEAPGRWMPKPAPGSGNRAATLR